MKKPINISERGIAALDTLLNAKEAGEIYNVDYKPAVEILNRDFEKADDKMFAELGRGARRFFRYDDFLGLTGYVTSLNKYVRVLTKYLKKPFKSKHDYETKEPDQYTNEARKLLDFYKSWQPLLPLRKELKPLIIKGRKPDPNRKPSKPKYIPPPQARESIKKLESTLKTLIESKHKDLVNVLYQQDLATVKRYLEDSDEHFESKGGKGYYSPYRWAGRSRDLAALIARVIENDPARTPENVLKLNRNSYDNYYPTRMKADAEKTLKSGAEWTARQITDQFVYKNTMKLTAIVGEKEKHSDAKLTKIDEGSTSFGRGAFEGTMHIEFSDGSKFEVRNKVVFKINRYHTMFAQFPTTFHQVHFPDGTKRAKQSEKQMNEVWVKASAKLDRSTAAAITAAALG